MDNKLIKISNIKLINILINVGCTIILCILLRSLISWLWLLIIPFVLLNILGFILSILLSRKIIVTFIIYFVLFIFTILVLVINSYNPNGYYGYYLNDFIAIINLNVFSGLIVFLIVIISNKIMVNNSKNNNKTIVGENDIENANQKNNCDNNYIDDQIWVCSNCKNINNIYNIKCKRCGKFLIQNNKE
jgi:hypothetical protein